MQTLIAILGGLGLFLLGMAVMTDGLKALAGSALRDVLARAAATPARGTLWGAIVTLMVQSSSATTMTTIGLVSAGLLTFPQGLSIVFGANIGTTGTGWLVALLGVRVSLTAAAMPLIFAGALMKLLGRGRWSGAGGAIAGFALLLAGLTTLQQGMGGLAERLNPADLPAVLGAGEVGLLMGVGGVLMLVVVGIATTAVMQSSSAAVAVTLSAAHAGAIGPDQAVALIIGQNVGTAISASIAAIGTTTPAKRTAVAYVLFKLIAASIALALFPLTTPLLLWASERADTVSLLALYHTGFNVVGVAILLPLVGRFSRAVERIVPQRGPVFTLHLDRSVLTVPAVAVEATRRTVAGVLEDLCGTVARALEDADAKPHDDRAQQAVDAMHEARVFLSNLGEPPASPDEQRRLSSTLHALDHTGRLAEAVRDGEHIGLAIGGPDGARTVRLCLDAMHAAEAIAAHFAAPAFSTRTDDPERNATHTDTQISQTDDATTASGALVATLEAAARDLAALRRTHRRKTLDAASAGSISPVEAIARVEAIRRLDGMTYHAWRGATHLAGEAEPVDAGTPDAQAPHKPATSA